MKFFSYLLLLLGGLWMLSACQSPSTTSESTESAAQAESSAVDLTKEQQLIQALEEVNGGWEHLLSKQDVSFTYNYHDFAKGTDISEERYIFEGETSWADYAQHEANVMPGVEGKVKQCFVNGKPEMTLDGEAITDEDALAFTEFLRRANYFWFTMMYKLDDPGTQHEYMGTEEVNGIEYDKMSLTYEGASTGKEQNDGYVLYINPETHLIDFFYFSLPLLGVNEPVLRMELAYEKVDGLYIATTRKLFAPNPETGEYVQGGQYVSSEIQFSNGFKESDLAL